MRLPNGVPSVASPASSRSASSRWAKAKLTCRRTSCDAVPVAGSTCDSSAIVYVSAEP